MIMTKNNSNTQICADKLLEKNRLQNHSDATLIVVVAASATLLVGFVGIGGLFA